MSQNLHAKFDPAQNEIRLAIMNFTINQKRAFNCFTDGYAALKPSLSEPAHFDALIADLVRQDGMVTNERGDVEFIYPVSAVPTRHRVRLADGREFSAMCAIDAMGATFTFGQDTEVHSSCGLCGKEVSLGLKAGAVAHASADSLHIITFRLEDMVNWAGSC